jgi:hypothetical protein
VYKQAPSEPVNRLLIRNTQDAVLSDSVVPDNRQAIRTAPVSASENNTPWPIAATIIQRFDIGNISHPLWQTWWIPQYLCQRSREWNVSAKKPGGFGTAWVEAARVELGVRASGALQEMGPKVTARRNFLRRVNPCAGMLCLVRQGLSPGQDVRPR